MPETLTWSLTVQIPGGPKLSSSQNLAVDAYDKVDVVIPHGGADHTVDIQPSGANQLLFLLISADRYADTLTYKPQDETGPGAAAVKLNAQQLLVGTGAVGLLQKPPKQLIFNNADGAHDANVQILAGRKV